MFKVYGLNEADEWFRIVRQFENHDVYYFPQYTKAFRLHHDGEPVCFYYQNGGVQAVNVVMKRDIAKCEAFRGAIPKNAWFDIATPYGYGGFLIEGEADARFLQQMNAQYCACCQKEGIISEFVRFHPLLKNHCGMESVYEIAELGKTVSMDLSSPAVIFANMVPQARNKMRKAQANGIEIRFGTEEKLFAQFKQMYDATMQRKNAQPYYYFGSGFYDSIRADLAGQALVAYAVLKEEIIAMAILLHANGRMHIHLEASMHEYVQLAPIVLLVAESALWGHAHGIKTLHFGGGVGSQGDNLYKFKSSFNKHSDNQFAVGKKVFDKDKYDFLLNLRQSSARGMLDPGFFPEYRAKETSARGKDGA